MLRGNAVPAVVQNVVMVFQGVFDDVQFGLVFELQGDEPLPRGAVDRLEQDFLLPLDLQPLGFLQIQRAGDQGEHFQRRGKGGRGRARGNIQRQAGEAAARSRGDKFLPVVQGFPGQGFQRLRFRGEAQAEGEEIIPAGGLFPGGLDRGSEQFLVELPPVSGEAFQALPGVAGLGVHAGNLEAGHKIDREREIILRQQLRIAAGVYLHGVAVRLTLRLDVEI